MAVANGYSTGSVKVFMNPSPREKDAARPSAFVDTTFDGGSPDNALRNMQVAAAGGAKNYVTAALAYLASVNAATSSAKYNTTVDIIRNAPTTTYTLNTAEKLFVETRLMPYYRAHRPGCHWAYVNYHSFSPFVTVASSVNAPSDAAWLYPNVKSSKYPSGCYAPTGSFTLEMFLNPRRSTDAFVNGGAYKPGTILHLSSSYALSLVSGSSRGPDGRPDGFRLLLQLSSSADVVPDNVTPGSGATLNAFLSDDNCLKFGAWHHVLVTWGTPSADAGTGSFYIDGQRRGTFVYNSSSILWSGGAKTSADVLTIGNFYVGPNSGSSGVSRFFSARPALREGLYQLDSTAGVDYPISFSFSYMLNAEVHDLSLRSGYLNQVQAQAIGSASPKLAPQDLSPYMLYVPPMFVPGGPQLTVVNGDGGVLTTPFESRDGANEHPFSADMSFGVAGRYNSLENFTRDFANGRYARVLHLTNSVIQNTETTALTANDILYSTGNVKLRNLMVLPCDDGGFVPNFGLASSLDLLTNPRFVDDIGAPEPALVSLRNMTSGTLYQAVSQDPTGSLFASILGATPETPTPPNETPAGQLAVYQRTGDSSSNEIVVFDVSNLFYGERIKPGSFSIVDADLTGSDGAVSVTLKDDGYGGLYRADATTAKAQWNTVGNVFYEEGIVLIKSPALPFFGTLGYTMGFEGERTATVSKFNVLVDAVSYNTSSNPSWSNEISASFDVNREPENQKFTAIGGVNFHDSNMNVVMRAQLAQPLVKRYGDRYLLRVKFDW